MVPKSKAFVFLISLSLCSLFSFSVFGQGETLTIVTYYPAPYGVYRELQVQDDDDSNIILGGVLDPGSGRTAGITLVDNSTTGGGIGLPSIHFQDHAYGGATNTPDFRIVMDDINRLWIIGGRGQTEDGPVGTVGPGAVWFGSLDDSQPVHNLVPGRITVGEIWFCDYSISGQ